MAANIPIMALRPTHIFNSIAVSQKDKVFQWQTSTARGRPAQLTFEVMRQGVDIKRRTAGAIGIVCKSDAARSGINHINPEAPLKVLPM